jgi:NAD(P)H-nitrite reductase large subunit
LPPPGCAQKPNWPAAPGWQLIVAFVNSYLQTSNPDIYALGDCAEINGKVLPFLQPIQLSAMYLAKNLSGVAYRLSCLPCW